MTTTGRRILPLLLALAMLAAPGAPAAAGADKVVDDLVFELQLVPLDGQASEAFELERLGDGKTVTLAQHRGQPVMLYFWATW